MNISKLTSVILAAMMTATAVPFNETTVPYNSFTSYAVEADEEEVIAEQELLGSGECGENLIWEVFKEESVLVISGTGAMTNWETPDAAPWAEFNDFIEMIVIREDVEAISKNCFSGINFNCVIYFDGNNCSIPDVEGAIPSDYYIVCNQNSTAHAYAEKYGIECSVSDDYTEQEFLGSGICGEDVYWMLEYDGWLTIYGEGEMDSYESADAAPWAVYSEDITNIVIESNIKSIGENCFDMCPNLFEATFYNPNCRIPDSETAIPAELITGFNGSTAQVYAEKYGKEYIEIISEIAFGFCGENAEWHIYSDTYFEVIGKGAMDSYEDFSITPWAEYVDAVTVINIHDSIDCIGKNTLGGFTNVDWVIIDNPDCIIPDCETAIPENAIISGYEGSTAQAYAEKYGRVFSPYEVDDDYTDDEYIDDDYVSESGMLGEDTYWSCNYSYLHIGGEGTVDGYEDAYDAPWADYSDTVDYIDIGEFVTAVGDNLFGSCSNASCIRFLNPDCVIPDSETAIPDYVVINGYSGSTAEAYAEKYGREFNNIGMEIVSGTLGDNIEWELRDNGKLILSGEGDMIDFDGANPWGEYASMIQHVDFSEEITSIGDYAFYGCENLKNAALTSVIGAHAYEGCKNLDSYSYYGEPDVDEIKDYAFSGCENLYGIDISNPDCVIADSPNVFHKNTSLTGYVGSTLEAYAEKYGREFHDIETYYDRPDDDYTDDDYFGVSIIDEGMCGENLIWKLTEVGGLYISGSGEMTDFESFEDTPWASYGDFVTMIGIDMNVDSIDAEAFSDFDNLSIASFDSVDCYIPMEESVLPVKEFIMCCENSTAKAYADMFGIETFILSGDETTDKEFTWSCNEDGDIFYITGYGDMPDYALGERPWEDVLAQIKYVYFYGSITSIGKNAFAGCENLKFVDIDEKIKFIDKDAFKGCDNLETLNFHSNYTCEIYDSADTIPANTVIIAHECTPAYEYAEKYGHEHYRISDKPVFSFASGSFGEGFTWKVYDEFNQLFISGTGAMPEWETSADAPWAGYFDLIEMVIFDENIDSIPANVFEGIEDNNPIIYFYNENCMVPDIEGSIPADSFVYCVENSPVHLYAEKYGLRYALIDAPYRPDAPEDIKTDDTLENSGSSNAEDFTWSCNEDGDIFYITGYGDMPDYAEGERPWEDVLDQIEYVYFYGNITSIGKNAFAGCENLKFVDIDEKIEFIGENAFKGCINLETLNFHGNYICEIYDSADTIPAHTTIIAHAGTPAQDYADKYSMTYYGIAGDANCDGKVSIADATAIFQSLGNPDKYALSDEGKNNADVADKGNGITVEDAILIQKYDAREVSAL